MAAQIETHCSHHSHSHTHTQSDGSLASLSLDLSLQWGERAQGAVSPGQGAGKDSHYKGVSVCVLTEQGSVRGVCVLIHGSDFFLAMHVQESIYSDVCLFELHLPVYTFESLFSGVYLSPLRLNKASVCELIVV